MWSSRRTGMSWSEWDRMSLREEFVRLASNKGTEMSELCRRFGISRKTGYKWRKRYQQEGRGGLADRSREPKSKPTPLEMEERIVEVRAIHRASGERKKGKLDSQIPAPLEEEGPRECPAGEGAGARIGAFFNVTSPSPLWRLGLPESQPTHALPASRRAPCAELPFLSGPRT